MEHSALTGSNLHEPKGVSSATAGSIYIADGIGSGSWTTAGASSLASTVQAFQSQLLQVRRAPASGTAAQAITSSTWTTLTVDATLTNEITGASLASNTITLPAGTYFIDAMSSWFYDTQSAAKGAMLRLLNSSDSTTTLGGLAIHSGQTGSTITVYDGGTVNLRGRFTTAGIKNFKLQMYSNAAADVGRPVTSGENEVYTDICIWKVA